MKTYEVCVHNQTDHVLNALNVPEDFFTGMTSDSIYEEYGAQFSLEECDFDKILIENIPQGTGLTFITIADAVANLPGSYIFAVLFYALMSLLAIGSMIGTLEGVLTPVADVFVNIPKVSRKFIKFSPFEEYFRVN